MRLIWHLFKKDTRRFWWEIVVTLGLLLWLAHLDRWRADYTPSSMEGWLNVLLPFAWSYLIALVVLEDPLVGDRQFWITLPCKWYETLAAKALFVLVFIHVPYLIAGAGILYSREFQPLLYLPQLLGKQLFLFTVLTLPVAALASVLKNVMQFVPIAILVAAAVATVNSGMPIAPWVSTDPLRRSLVLATLAVGSTAALLLQYARRRTALSRSVALSAALVAILVHEWLPRDVSAAAFCAVSLNSVAVSPISVHVSPSREVTPELLRNYSHFQATAATIAIPIDLTGAPAGVSARFNQLAFELEGSEGDRHEMSLPTTMGPSATPTLSVWLHPYEQPSWQIVRMDRALYNRLQNRTVRIRGDIVANFYRSGSATTLPFAERRAVSGVGTCSSLLVAAWREELIRVDCESPSEIPIPTFVRLIDTKTRRDWRALLGDSGTVMPYPRLTWLSPVNRRSTFFHVSTQDLSEREGSKWLVPEQVISTAEIEITPQPLSGCTVVNYELKDVPLNRFQIATRR
jgi:hypothetical protein